MHAIDIAWRQATTDVGLVAWTANRHTWTMTRVTASDDALLGFPRRAWRARGFWLDRVDPVDRDRVAHFFAAVSRGEQVQPIEYPIQDALGELHRVRTAAVLTPMPGGCQIAGVHRDLTEIGLMRETLVSATERRVDPIHRDIWDSLPASAVVVDAGGVIVEANPAWFEAAAEGGAPPHAFIGESYIDAMRIAARTDKQARHAYDGLVSILERGEKRFAFDYLGQGFGSGERWFRMNAFALRPPARGAMIIHWDVTERKHAELAVQRGRDQFAHMQRLATMNELATTIAHELNQPLAVIMSAAFTVRRSLRAGDGRDMSPLIADIIGATNRAAEVTRNARSMIRRDIRVRESFSLNDIVASVERLLASDLVLHQVKLTTDLDPHLSPVIGDRIQLQQVLVNLLLNAIEAVEDQARYRRSVRVTTRRAGAGVVELVVSDSGPGIAPAIAERAFDAFATTKRERMGLGLTIVRAIAEAHGGKVSIEQAMEGGAAFRLIFPCESEVCDHVQR
jgi:signal transduction histidine kinase